MMNFKRAALIAPFLLSVMTACESSPTEAISELEVQTASANGTRRFVDEDFQDMADNLMLFACDAEGIPTDESGGEWIRLRGGLFTRFVISFTPAGGIHINYHTMPVGLAGTGETSGEEFRVKTSNHGNLSLGANGAVVPYVYTETLVGMDTGRRMTLKQSGVYRVTGERVVVERDRNYLDCRI
jgi:hypothetical protein